MADEQTLSSFEDSSLEFGSKYTTPSAHSGATATSMQLSPTNSPPGSPGRPRLLLQTPSEATILEVTASGPPSPTASVLSSRRNTTSPTPERQLSAKARPTTQLSTNIPTIFHAQSSSSLKTSKSFSDALKDVEGLLETTSEPGNIHEEGSSVRPKLGRLRSGQLSDRFESSVPSSSSMLITQSEKDRRKLRQKLEDYNGAGDHGDGSPGIASSLSSSLSDAMTSMLPSPKLPAKAIPIKMHYGLLSAAISLASSPTPSNDDSILSTSPKSTTSAEVISTRTQRKESVGSIIAQRARKRRVNQEAGKGDGDAWTDHGKHFFVLSSAGKPVWARYGDEAHISSLMGVVQAIVSSFADNDDTIRSITTESHKFAFMLKDPLYFVAISRTGESEAQLREQLTYLYSQIVSVLTGAQLTRIFEERVNYDLRRLLGGTEVFLDSLSAGFSEDHSFMLGAVECLKMPRETRDRVGDALAGGKVKDLLYAMIVGRGKLVSLLRPKKHSLHPSDLHILFNMLHNTATFDPTFESWTPLCLPKFNPRGFLHAFIGGLGVPDCWVVMVTTERNAFFELREGKLRLFDLLQNGLGLEGLRKSVEDVYTVADTGIPGIRHFLYKNKLNVQFTMPEKSEFYTEEVERRRLFRLYQHVYDCMHSKARPLKLYFHNSGHEEVLGWITTSFELYIALGPLSKISTITCANQLVRWIKKHEESLFIINSPVF